MRLIMYIRRGLRKGALPFVFEPNDQITRDNLKAMADGYLNDILAKRGLTDYATVCDDSNNTPDRIDRNEMYLDVALQPTRAAEFIYIPIRVTRTDAF
jgi:phage tail sheath protein FI